MQHFEAPDVITWLNAAQPAELDAAPFGIVAMEAMGIIRFYNRFEEELAGLDRSDVVSRDFFVDVAPCTNNFMVREPYVEAWEHGRSLDEIIRYTFSYRMKATPVRLRMLVSDRRGWLLVEPRG